MLLVGHQPEFSPWLGFFHKLSLGDIYMVVDHVQFKKRHFENRNRIRTLQGWGWLTVPVRTHDRFEQPINQVETDERAPWRRKVTKSIEVNYAQAPYFADYWPFFSELFQRPWPLLADLNEALIRGCLDFLSIKPEIVKSSELGVEAHGSELIVAMCQAVGTKVYLSGQSGKDYLDPDVLDAGGIQVQYQAFSHPEYRQMHQPFEPQMSIIDLLFNEGENAGEIVRRAGGIEDCSPT
jgi:hypothetical protein